MTTGAMKEVLKILTMIFCLYANPVRSFSKAAVNQGKTAGHRDHILKSLSAKTKLFSSTSPHQTLVELEDGSYYSDDQIIKKSHFIGIAKYCNSWNAAKDFVENIRAEHPKARHVCFAYVGGFNPQTERASDDGEPQGTAGIPILGAINGEEVSDTVCIVVRYSGGIKLGAGGLIRAYGGTARMALRAAEKKILIPKSTTNAITASSNAGQVYSVAAKYSGLVENEIYHANGDVEVSITCDTAIFDCLVADLTDACRGDIIYRE